MKFISTLTDCLLNQDGREYTHWRSTWRSYLMTYVHTWWTLRRLAQLNHWMTDIVAKCKSSVIDYVMQGESFTFMVLDYVGSIKKMKQIAGSHQWWWCIYDIHVMNVLAKQELAVVTKFWTSHVLGKTRLTAWVAWKDEATLRVDNGYQVVVMAIDTLPLDLPFE